MIALVRRLVWLTGLSLILFSQYGIAQIAQTDLERRIRVQEEIKADVRLTALETRLNSIETTGKGVLIAVVAQLILSGLNFHWTAPRRARRESDADAQ